MSQTDLAKAANISQSVIADIESGEQKTSRALPRIATALDVDIWVLDPDFAKEKLSPANAVIALEVLLEFIRPDLNSERRQSLARVFLDLAQEPLDGTIGGSLAQQYRMRVKIEAQQYQPKP